MSVRIPGIEWNQYYNDPTAWPEGAWHEEADIAINGITTDADYDLSAVPLDATVVLYGGIVYLPNGQEDLSLETHFKRWRKRQNTIWLLVEVTPNTLKAVRTAITQAGGRMHT